MPRTGEFVGQTVTLLFLISTIPIPGLLCRCIGWGWNSWHSLQVQAMRPFQFQFVSIMLCVLFQRIVFAKILTKQCLWNTSGSFVASLIHVYCTLFEALHADFDVWPSFTFWPENNCFCLTLKKLAPSSYLLEMLNVKQWFPCAHTLYNLLVYFDWFTDTTEFRFLLELLISAAHGPLAE